MIKISKYYLVRNLTNNSNEIWGYQQVQTLLDTLGVTLKQLNLRFGHFISIDGSYNNLNGDAVEVTTDPTSMYVKLLQTGSQFGIWNRKVNTNLDDYTVVLLHFDESTTEDECGNLWTKYGNPILTTENAKFGRALKLDGSSYLSLDGGIALGGQDFTIDCWVKGGSMISPGKDPSVIEMWQTASTNTNRHILLDFSAIDFQGQPIGVISCWYPDNLSTLYTFVPRTDFPIAEMQKLHHYAIVYHHSIGKKEIYIDGVKMAESFGTIARDTAPNLTIGRTVWGKYADHTIDELRISDGIARWTEDFTPPIAPYGS